MRITVECGGFTRAADACLTANHTSAVLLESLTSRLAASTGMAGNDATSIGFAAAYDTGAREAVAALADLTHAFVGAGRLLVATGANHASAEVGAGGIAVLGYSADAIDDSAFVRVRPASLPSSLGRQEPSLGVVDAWILDQVEGFVWPGADVEALRAAAHAWRRAAASTAGLADHVDMAVTLVEGQRSPEVPLAASALGELIRLIGDTAWQLSDLAAACEEYADAVEEIRYRTRALLAEVAQMIVEGAAISVIVTGITGGLGGGATAVAAAARVRVAGTALPRPPRLAACRSRGHRGPAQAGPGRARGRAGSRRRSSCGCRCGTRWGRSADGVARVTASLDGWAAMKFHPDTPSGSTWASRPTNLSRVCSAPDANEHHRSSTKPPPRRASTQS